MTSDPADFPPPGALPEVYPRNPPLNNLRGPELAPANFFTFEGIDGAGKTTVARAVARACEESGRTPVLLRLGRSSIVSHALERAKWVNADPVSINLLNWISIYEETIDLRERLGDDRYRIFFDRYALTIRTRGMLEGMVPDFVPLLEARTPRPARIFLIDAPPEVCLERIRAGGRTISYYEAGSRDAERPGEAMVERSEDDRRTGAGNREPGLLVHLQRMRDLLLDLSRKYPQTVMVDGTRPLEEVVAEVVRHLGLGALTLTG